MKTEIGSEFWDIPILEQRNNFFPTNTAWFISGRSALRAIIKDIKKSFHNVSTAALPSWCCDSMIAPFLCENIDVYFYSVSIVDGNIKRDINIKCDITLVMDYFGFADKNDVISDGIVIRDLTHSVFNNSHKDADYYFGSLRKWCGFYTGGFAFGLTSPERTSEQYTALRKDAMLLKKSYIDGFTDQKKYLEMFGKAENMLDCCELLAADSEDIESAQKINIDFIRKKRFENANFLTQELSDYTLFNSVGKNDLPLFVPIAVKSRDKLKSFLIENNIYCPVHWPLTQLHRISESDSKIYGEELSLICDQRYGIEEMARIAEFVKKGVAVC